MKILNHFFLQRNSTRLNHLFFHSLSYAPSLSFRADNDSVHDFESWFVTVDEFKAVLERLLERGYVLVDVHEAIEGRIKLPEDKKPLVLSFDDMNYYDYMDGYGFASRMILTEDNRIANICKDACGKESVCFEADAVPIVESFIGLHPGFSHHGARGVIALTGYEGVLGYRNPEESSSQLAPLVNELKRRGWKFASHSWGHHHRAYSNRPIVIEKGRNDIRRWFKEVEPHIGPTDLFVTPFGIDTRRNFRFDSFLRKCGFRYFFSVGRVNAIQKTFGAYYQDRIPVDGVNLRQFPYVLFPFIGNPAGFLSPFRCRDYPVKELTANALLAFAESCLNIKTIYLWGGMGEIVTDHLLKCLAKVFPDAYDRDKMAYLQRFKNQGIRGFDCSGLLKCFVMGGLENFKRIPAMDLNSEGLLRLAFKKGPVSSLPERPGICLYMKGHTGIYAGRGYVIEATSNPRFGNGVVKTRLSDRLWEQWYEFPWVNYGSV